MTTFSPGDLVFLKSGGPMMTVSHCPANRRVYVDWFADDDQCSSEFHPDQLMKAEGLALCARPPSGVLTLVRNNDGDK